MNYDVNLKGKSGIYSIKCIVNNKQYIGKSKNLYNRFKAHTTCLNNKLSKNENQYLINAWHKYKEDNFIFEVLEFCNIEDLSTKELFYMDRYKTLDREFGYNLRYDSSSGMIVTDETRVKLSISQKNRYANMSNEELEKFRQNSRLMWEKWSDEFIDEVMNKVSKTRTKYKYHQYTKSGELIKIWDCIRDILKANPNYKRHNIYAVTSGEKPSMYGYIWKQCPIIKI